MTLFRIRGTFDRPGGHVEYLAALARAAVAEEPRPVAPPPALDWNWTHDLLTAHHAALPTLAAVLPLDAAPAAARESLDARRRALRDRSTFILDAVPRVAAALAETGVAALFLKGPVLGATVYPSPSSRAVGDLDVLVDRAAVPAASAALERIGFSTAATRAHPEFYERHHFHRVLRDAAGVVVELHWDLTRPGDFVRFDLDGIRVRARDVAIAGVAVRAPEPGDLLLHAAAQAMEASFSDLRHVFDAALLARAERFDAAALARRARDAGVGPSLWALLVVMREVTGRREAEAIEQSVAPEPFPRACILRLDPRGTCLTRRALDFGGYRNLLRWWCAPTLRARLLEMSRFVFPRDADLLELGADPERMPGTIARARLAATRAWSLVKALAFQGAHDVRSVQGSSDDGR